MERDYNREKYERGSNNCFQPQLLQSSGGSQVLADKIIAGIGSSFTQKNPVP
jgi:hypothetical protein